MSFKVTTASVVSTFITSSHKNCTPRERCPREPFCLRRNLRALIRGKHKKRYRHYHFRRKMEELKGGNGGKSCIFR